MPTYSANRTNAVAPIAPTYFCRFDQWEYALPASISVWREGAGLEERNIMGELNMYRQLGLKPNFSEIESDTASIATPSHGIGTREGMSTTGGAGAPAASTSTAT